MVEIQLVVFFDFLRIFVVVFVVVIFISTQSNRLPSLPRRVLIEADSCGKESRIRCVPMKEGRGTPENRGGVNETI